MNGVTQYHRPQSKERSMASVASVIEFTGNRSIMARAMDWNSPLVRSTDRCPRCGGLMVHEWGTDPIENAGQRCVQCGELVDSVILENRRLQHAGASSLGTK
jgi:ribosomal protein S14